MALRRHSNMDDMMEMGMGGMDMGSATLFTPDNKYRARIFWYIIAASVSVMTLARAVTIIQSWQRRRRTSSKTSPSRPSSRIEQVLATSTAVYRELSYPQPLWFSGRFAKYFSPPSLGRCLLLAVYWIVILTLLWSDVLMQPNDAMYPYRWEKVGFRAAWISVTQIPFIYLLSCKFNPISLLTGVSYERFNWLHRWAARTVFLTVIVHWSYFFFEWWQADFVEYELKLMPMVKYGFGAWAVIGWMIVSGFGFFRAASYEIFVIQHIFAAATLLWLLYVHVPAYAAYNVWLSIGFLAFDWGTRIILGMVRNLHLSSFVKKLPGYAVRLEPLSDGMVRLTIDDTDFKWRAGQHIYLSLPSVRPLELHPFTIANSATAFDGSRRSLTMVIKPHRGFSKSLYVHAEKDIAAGRSRRAFLSWPLGSPPDVSHYDTVILLACSTGASFVVPLLQDLVRSKGCVRQVKLHWLVKSREHIEWYKTALLEALEAARSSELPLDITIHVTRFQAASSSSSIESTLIADAKEPIIRTTSHSTGSSSSSEKKDEAPFLNVRLTSGMDALSLASGRPAIEQLIRPGVEGAHGETAVISCGGLGFTADVRTYVAMLSDERAVHKGTGAQGIYLYTETYGW